MNCRGSGVTVHSRHSQRLLWSIIAALQLTLLIKVAFALNDKGTGKKDLKNLFSLEKWVVVSGKRL